jgi:hypothetical protein
MLHRTSNSLKTISTLRLIWPDLLQSFPDVKVSEFQIFLCWKTSDLLQGIAGTFEEYVQPIVITGLIAAVGGTHQESRVQDTG